MVTSNLAHPLISLEEMERLQLEIALNHDGIPGVRQRYSLDAAIQRPIFRVKDASLYSSPPRRASILINELITRRPFLSCNRRTAIEAATIWLEREGWRLLCSAKDLAEKVDQLAEGHLPEQQFYLWLARHSRPKPGSHPGGDPGMRRIGSRANWDPVPEAYSPEVGR